jgi:hypothetical protein
VGARRPRSARAARKNTNQGVSLTVVGLDPPRMNGPQLERFGPAYWITFRAAYPGRASTSTRSTAQRASEGTVRVGQRDPLIGDRGDGFGDKDYAIRREELRRASKAPAAPEGWRFCGPTSGSWEQNCVARRFRVEDVRILSLVATTTWSWRRRPDLNRGWRFCRFRKPGHVGGFPCLLVTARSRFYLVFGR